MQKIFKPEKYVSKNISKHIQVNLCDILDGKYVCRKVTFFIFCLLSIHFQMQKFEFKILEGLQILQNFSLVVRFVVIFYIKFSKYTNYGIETCVYEIFVFKMFKYFFNILNVDFEPNANLHKIENFKVNFFIIIIYLTT